jgi:hypothetical protein
MDINGSRQDLCGFDQIQSIGRRNAVVTERQVNVADSVAFGRLNVWLCTIHADNGLNAEFLKGFKPLTATVTFIGCSLTSLERPASHNSL